jgi:hypothetical protein
MSPGILVINLTLQSYIILKAFVGAKAKDAVADAELGGCSRARNHSLDGTGNVAAQDKRVIDHILSWSI